MNQTVIFISVSLVGFGLLRRLNTLKDVKIVTKEENNVKENIKCLKIYYCSKCNWTMRACWMATELLTTFSEDIIELKLIPSKPGTYKIEADSLLLWDRKVQNKFPYPKDLKRIIREKVLKNKQLGHCVLNK